MGQVLVGQSLGLPQDLWTSQAFPDPAGSSPGSSGDLLASRKFCDPSIPPGDTDLGGGPQSLVPGAWKREEGASFRYLKVCPPRSDYPFLLGPEGRARSLGEGTERPMEV